MHDKLWVYGESWTSRQDSRANWRAEHGGRRAIRDNLEEGARRGGAAPMVGVVGVQAERRGSVAVSARGGEEETMSYSRTNLVPKHNSAKHRS